MQKPKEPTALEAMEAECDALTKRLADYGLGFQIPAGALFEAAFVKLLELKGIIVDKDEWSLLVATLKRDALAEGVAQAPQIQKQVQAEQRKKNLLVPDHVRARMNPKLN